MLLQEPEGVLVVPDGPPCAAVLVLPGSSGRVERDRARLLASRGAAALSIRWFGGPGQPPGICEVPLDTFRPALDRLLALHARLTVLGISKGAEAALLLGTRDPRVRAVVALSPTSVVWANVGPGRDGADHPYRSSWTADGRPLPFVPYDDDWTVPEAGPAVAYRAMYESSLARFGDRVAAARIPVELIAGPVLVSGGGDDQLWPSDRFAREIAEARAARGLTTRLITSPAAGHLVLLPGEPEVGPRAGFAYGGSPPADRSIGERVLSELSKLLPLRA
ncbi:MAG: acyl-CoA thioester hydrolase/BAAT C-terminal domain-containing protein [Candidatus Dormibacteraceae bacterium]